jgi:hypothetical protein
MVPVLQPVVVVVTAHILAHKQIMVSTAVMRLMRCSFRLRSGERGYFVVAALICAAVGALPLDMMAFDAATVPAGELES